MRALLWIVLVLLSACAQTASGAVEILSDEADGAVFQDGTISDSANTGRVGSATGNGFGRVSIFVFQLPPIPSGFSADVTAATLKFNIVSIAGARTYDIDLYGLTSRSDSWTVETDFFAGSEDAEAQIIQSSVIPAESSSTGLMTVSNEALRSYVASQYGPAGENAGMYLFLRLNPDEAQTQAVNSGVNVSFAESGTAASLTIGFEATSVPEPMSLAMLLPAIGLTVYSRRNR